jgi:uncharacterized protein
MHQKYNTLLEVVRKYEKVGICLSGGSGSALVAIAAVEALGAENVVAITANTPFFTGEELLSSKDLCKRLGIRLYVPNTNLLMNTEVVTNGPDRCYHCKKCIIDVVQNTALELGIHTLLDGSCASPEHFAVQEDHNEKVLSELGIVCPLRIADINREDVYEIMNELSMGYYVRPENACLATRVAQGEPITLKKIRWIRAAENYIHSLGYGLVRVRVEGNAARIEVAKEDVEDLMRQREEVEIELNEMGFKEITIDEEGYKREAASCL